jgi:rSAM/selenodomain-associated transferase 2
MPLSMNNTPAISIIIPVLSEAGGINGLIAHLQALDPGRSVEIIVVDGDPDGSTISAITDASVVTTVCDPGRAAQMNHGATFAKGDVLLFLHADTFLPSDAFARISAALRDQKYVAGCFSLGIRSDRALFRITERYVALRTRVTRIPFGDQGVFIRRDYFERLGGYADIPIMEDVELMQRIRGHGDAICIIPERVTTSARRWEREGILFTTFRNWALQALYCLGVTPKRLVRFYRS